MNPEQATEFVLALAKEQHVDNADCLFEDEQSTSIKVLNGRVEKVDQSRGQGLGIRIIEGGKTGLAYTEKITPTHLEDAFGLARQNATLQDSSPVFMHQNPAHYPDPAQLKLYSESLNAVKIEDMCRFGLEIEDTARSADSRVKSVPFVGVGIKEVCFRLVSTHGVTYTQKQNLAYAHCQSLLAENDRLKSGFESWISRQWQPQQAVRIAQKSVDDARKFLPATNMNSGNFPVVIDEHCAPQLLGMFLGAFSAEEVQKKRSRLAGLLEKKIAAEQLNISSDPHLEGALASSYADAEGTPTTKLSLVEQGVLQNFVYHNETAQRENKRSTGHATRGYASGIKTTLHNISMPCGQHSLEELIGLYPQCLLVTKLEGAAGCNSMTGDISIGIQGFWVEQGQIVRPIEQVTISGNFFDLLHKISHYGNAYQPNLSSVFIPALAIDSMKVSG